MNPQAIAFLRRYAEPAIAGGLAVLLARSAWVTAAAGGSLVWVGFEALAALAASLWALTALQRQRVAAGSQRGGLSPGVLRVEEERIGYFGPESGGFLAMDQVESVALCRGADASWTWYLMGPDQHTLTIPGGALGAEALVDALAGLPEFETARALDVLSRDREGCVTVWERSGRRVDAIDLHTGEDPAGPISPRQQIRR